ncbi:hypothetical protein ACIRU3_05625 [Streptomyces sp. NPDC101151]|uniref:hypothetical protein n=1 Tax=Streptomyces sp. NPDC101151 TaxID=3366115 RepID=UPI00381548AE
MDLQVVRIPVADPPARSLVRAGHRAGFLGSGALESQQFVLRKAQHTGQGNNRLG